MPRARRPTTRSSPSFLEQYYARATSIPREVYLPGGSPTDAADLEAFLADRRGGPVHLQRRRSAARSASCMELATRNAAETLAREQARWLADQGKTLAALEELADGARSARPAGPHRVLRHQQLPGQRVGRRAWSSSRTASRGSGEYRRFRIKTVQGPNDFASHQEVLRRRFRGPKPGEEGSEEERRWAMPDLVIIDGGKGQVSAAKEVLDELGLHDLPLAGLAKEREELFLPGPRRSRSCCRRRRRRSTSSSGSATRRTGSPSPTTATCAPSATVRSAFDDLPGRRARSASASCSRCSARSSASARRRSSRSPPCPASAARWPSGSRRPSRRDAGSRRRRPGRRSVYHPASMRRAGPILIILIGVLALVIDFFPGLKLPDTHERRAGVAHDRDEARASTCRAACASSTRRCRSTGKSPTPADMAIIKDIVERRVNATGVSEPVVVTQGTDRVVVELPGVTDPDAVRQLVGQTGRLDFVPLGQTPGPGGPGPRPQGLPAAVQRRPGPVAPRSAQNQQRRR